ncbi:hypothetical protein SKAU_G00085410 [Synaphobranchus kaupii]|uniref:Uncharacterized protein n=1 Tax=Synaphobranchus kaupii TaxID=118154 RepID=A0A9Q1FVH8_SYNKA|nr:hypothetical protein SKAU_G00085410 [Synaphobranchus kaupii]
MLWPAKGVKNKDRGMECVFHPVGSTVTENINSTSVPIRQLPGQQTHSSPAKQTTMVSITLRGQDREEFSSQKVTWFIHAV